MENRTKRALILKGKAKIFIKNLNVKNGNRFALTYLLCKYFLNSQKAGIDFFILNLFKNYC